MTQTTIRGEQITDDTVYREDLNTDLTGRAVITKVIAGTGISISSTGVDAGTGDVTITNTNAVDYLSGLYYIGSGETKTIPLYSQMITKGGTLELIGNIVVAGQLYVEN